MTGPAAPTDSAGGGAPTTAHDRLIVAARGDARFCFRLGDVSEVGKIIHLARLDGPHEAFLGSTVLHGWSVPVIDAAAAIGAVAEQADKSPMFVATQTHPPVCIVVDEIVGMRRRGPGGARAGPHELVRELVTLDGRSLPVVDVSAVARLAGAAAAPAPGRDGDGGQNT